MSYPDPFCVKCQSHTPVVGSRSVVLETMLELFAGHVQSATVKFIVFYPRKKMTR